MAKNRGRPTKAKANHRTNILRICLTSVERQAIEASAQAEHMNMSAWARTVILREAEKKGWNDHGQTA